MHHVSVQLNNVLVCLLPVGIFGMYWSISTMFASHPDRLFFVLGMYWSISTMFTCGPKRVFYSAQRCMRRYNPFFGGGFVGGGPCLWCALRSCRRVLLGVLFCLRWLCVRFVFAVVCLFCFVLVSVCVCVLFCVFVFVCWGCFSFVLVWGLLCVRVCVCVCVLRVCVFVFVVVCLVCFMRLLSCVTRAAGTL